MGVSGHAYACASHEENKARNGQQLAVEVLVAHRADLLSDALADPAAHALGVVLVVEPQEPSSALLDPELRPRGAVDRKQSSARTLDNWRRLSPRFCLVTVSPTYSALWTLPLIVALLTLGFGLLVGWDAGLRIGGGCVIVGLAQAVLFERLVATEEARRACRYYRVPGSRILTGTRLGSARLRPTVADPARPWL